MPDDQQPIYTDLMREYGIGGSPLRPAEPPKEPEAGVIRQPAPPPTPPPKEEGPIYTDLMRKYGIGPAQPAVPAATAEVPAIAPAAPPPATPVPAPEEPTYTELDRAFGLGPAAPAAVAPTAAAPAPTPPPAPAEPQPAAMGGFQEPPKPTGPFAPTGKEFEAGVTPAQAEVAQYDPLAAYAARPATESDIESLKKLPATINAHLFGFLHGVARAADEAANLPWRLSHWDWEKPAPAFLSYATGELLKLASPESGRADPQKDPITYWFANLAGGLATYLIPGAAWERLAGYALPGMATGKTAGALAAAGYEIPGVAGASAAVQAAAQQAVPFATRAIRLFGSNLFTFASTDALSALGQGGGAREVKDALVNSVPTAALFTVAGALPMDQIAKNPWMVKALESSATGTAFTASHLMQGERSIPALLVSFLTGFGLHAIQSGVPQRPERGWKVDWDATDAIKAEKDYREFYNVWVKEHLPTANDKILFDDALRQVEQHATVELQKTAQPVWPTAEEKHQAIFAGRIQPDLTPADNVRQLAPQVGGMEQAQRFYDLYKAGDADTALREFPDLVSWATPQQKAAEVRPGQPPEMVSAGVLIPGAYSAKERKLPEAKPEAVFRPEEELPPPIGGKPADYLDSLVRKVNAGDPKAAADLNAALSTNQEALGNLFRMPPGERAGLKEIADRAEILMSRVEHTGDAEAARELTDLLRGNEETLRGVKRWEVAQAAGVPWEIQEEVNLAPQTKKAKLTEDTVLRPESQINEVTLDGFIKILRSGDIEAARKELATITGNVATPRDFDHLFNSAYMEQRIRENIARENGVDLTRPLEEIWSTPEFKAARKEAANVIAPYEKEIFGPVRAAFAEKAAAGGVPEHWTVAREKEATAAAEKLKTQGPGIPSAAAAENAAIAEKKGPEVEAKGAAEGEVPEVTAPAKGQAIAEWWDGLTADEKISLGIPFSEKPFNERNQADRAWIAQEFRRAQGGAKGEPAPELTVESVKQRRIPEGGVEHEVTMSDGRKVTIYKDGATGYWRIDLEASGFDTRKAGWNAEGMDILSTGTKKEALDFLPERLRRLEPYRKEVAAVPAGETPGPLANRLIGSYEEAVQKEVAKQLASSKAYWEKYHPDEALSEESINNATEAATKRVAEWYPKAIKALNAAEAIQARLQTELGMMTNTGKVEIAGSIARGDFFDKGNRDFDLDFHLSGLDIADNRLNNKTRVVLDGGYKDMIRRIRKDFPDYHVDFFVTHDGKLWAVNEKTLNLDRSPAAFGKMPVMMPNGLVVQGKPKSWEDFQAAFYRDLGRPEAKPALPEEIAPTKAGEAAPRVYQDENKWWHVEGVDRRFGTKEAADKVASRIKPEGYKVEEAAAGAPGQGLTVALAEETWPGSKVTQITDTGALAVEHPNGSKFVVMPNGDIALNKDILAKDYGQSDLRPEQYLAGAYTTIGRNAFIALSKFLPAEETRSVLRHENFELAMKMALTVDEQAAVLKEHGSKEAAADAFAEWRDKEVPNTLFQKIKDFFQALLERFVPPGETAESVFKKIETGEVWLRDVRQDAKPQAEYSVRTLDEWAAKAAKEAGKRGLDPDSVLKDLPDIRRIGQILMERPDLLPVDEKGNPIRTNIDYKLTADIDTNCPRRLEYNANIKAIEDKLNRPLTSDEMFGIAMKMQAEGKVGPCIYCYVEGARRAFSEALYKFQATRDPSIDLGKFLKWYNGKAEGKEIAVTPAEEAQFRAARGYANLVSRMNASKAFSAYTGQLFNRGIYPDVLLNEINDRAGLRFQSNTDFQPHHTIDLMQIIVDLAILDMKAHAYTKQPDFVKIFGRTGMRINISTFAKEVNGKIVDDPRNGMAWEQALKLRDQYPNAGVIMVTTSDATTRWAMEQPWIDLIIPFHRSGMTKEQFASLGWRDYTHGGGEKWIKPKEHRLENGKPVEPPHFVYAEHQNNFETYIELCKEAGVYARFKEFLPGPDATPQEKSNYMKLITDVVRPDIPQEPVRPTFDYKAAEEAIRTWQKGEGYTYQKQADPDFVQRMAEKIMGGEKLYGPEAYAIREHQKAGPEPVLPPDALEAGKEKEEITVYHGTPHEFTSFDYEFGQKQAAYGRGIYFSDHPEVAKDYSAPGSRTPRIMEAKLNKKDLLDLSSPEGAAIIQQVGEYFGVELKDVKDFYDKGSQGKGGIGGKGDKLRELAEAAGYKGVAFPAKYDYPGYTYGGNHYVIYDTSIIPNRAEITPQEIVADFTKYGRSTQNRQWEASNRRYEDLLASQNPEFKTKLERFRELSDELNNTGSDNPRFEEIIKERTPLMDEIQRMKWDLLPNIEKGLALPEPFAPEGYAVREREKAPVRVMAGRLLPGDIVLTPEGRKTVEYISETGNERGTRTLPSGITIKIPLEKEVAIKFAEDEKPFLQFDNVWLPVERATPVIPAEIAPEGYAVREEAVGEPSGYLYHGTPEKNLNEIRKYGLQSKTRQRNDWEEGDRTPQEQELLYFEREENQNWGSKKSVQLRINEDLLPRGIDIQEDALRPGEFYTYSHNNEPYGIPPEAIEFYNKKTKRWEPLVPAPTFPAEIAPEGYAVRKKEEGYPTGKVTKLPGGAEAVELTHLPEEIAPEEIPAGEKVSRTVIQKYMPGYDFAKDFKSGVFSSFAPAGKSSGHYIAASILGSHLGGLHQAVEVTYHKFDKDSRAFVLMAKENIGKPLDEDSRIQFMSDMSMGRPVGEGLSQPMRDQLKSIADRIRGAFYDRIQRLKEVDAPLERLREFYFPGMWEKKSIRAFNLAMEEAIAAGRGGEAREGGAGGQIMDVNDWNPADIEWVGNRTRELYAADEGSDKSYLSYLTRRPLKGTESFRKAKVFDDIMLGIRFGLEPISKNPIDLVKLKLTELDRSIMMNGALQEFRAPARVEPNNSIEQPWKAVNLYGKTLGTFETAKEAQAAASQWTKENATIVVMHTSDSIKNHPGWQKINDPWGTIMGPYDPKTGTRPVIGHYIATDAVADILNGYTSSSLYNSPGWGQAYKGYMFTANLLNEIQLGMGSLFHAGFTSMETQISAGSDIIRDAYGLLRGNRTWGELGQTLKKYPTAVLQTAMKGSKVLSEFQSPSMDVAVNLPISMLRTDGEYGIALLAKTVALAGGGTSMERGLRTYQTEAMRRDWYAGNRLRAIARSPVALVEVTMWPVLQWLVPRQKLGVYGEMVNRIMEQALKQNPDMTLNELRPAFREAWNMVDQRLGQVRYDRIFMDNWTKNVVQALIRAPGWTGGTIVQVGGAPLDAARFLKEWVTTGKAPADIPYKVAYTISLFATVMAVNGILTKAFTGEDPHGVDFFAFRSGGNDIHGNPNRWVLPTYMKDLFHYAQDPAKTILDKGHPLLSLIADVYRNRTYYGEQITSDEASFLERKIDQGKFIVKNFVPFWMAGAAQAAERGGGWTKTFEEGKGRLAPPILGVMPAPRAYTATDAQKVIDKYNELSRASITTKETAEMKQAKRDLLELARNKDQVGFETAARQAVESGQLTLKTVKEVIKESQTPAGMTRFTKLPLDWAAKAYAVGTPEEKKAWKPYMLKKLIDAKPEMLLKHQEKIDAVLKDMGLGQAATALSHIELPSGYTKADLSALGVTKEMPEIEGMEAVDAALADAFQKATGEKPEKKKALFPTIGSLMREKKNRYEVLGL